MKKYESISSLVWLIVVVAILVGSYRLNFGRWDSPGPGFLPMLTGIIIGGVALVNFVIATIEKNRSKKEKEEVDPPIRWKILVMTMVAMFGYALLMEPLGFTLCTFLFMGFTFRIAGTKRWKAVGGKAILVTVASYVIFKIWLNVPLPIGFFGI